MIMKMFFYTIFTIILSVQVFSQQLNWQQLHAPVATSLTGITQLPNGDFYLSTKTRGVYKSTDNGTFWTECNGGFSNLYINDIYSTDDDKIFACSGTTIFQFDEQNEMWINLNAPQADYNCISVNSLGYIIAGSNSGIFRSTDEGATWQAATTYLASVYSLTSAENDILFAGAIFGVFKSIDNGDTWTQVGMFDYHVVSDIVIDNSGDIYANVFYRGYGVYLSQDQGVTWEQINAGLTEQLTTTVAIDADRNIYVGTFEGGIFRKEHGQPSFVQVNLHHTMSQVLDLYTTLDNKLFICSEFGGLFRKNESTPEWEQLNSGLPLEHSIPLGFDSDDNLYMGNLFSGVYRSTDEGNSWFPIAYYLGGSHRFSFLANNNQLILGTTIEIAYLGMLFRSTDKGEGWEYFHEGIPLIHPSYPYIQVVLGMAVNSNGDLFAALNTEGAYRRLTTDTSWHFINSDIPDTNIFSICVNSNDLVFAGYRNGYIYKSDDNGETWVQSLSGIQDYTVELLKSDGEYVFAILHNWNYPYQDSSLGYYSNDNGNNWIDLNISGVGSRVNSIGFYNGIIVIGTDTSGVFVSSNFGNNWIASNEGLSDKTIKGIVVLPDGLLLCGTENEGIYLANLNPTNVHNTNNTAMRYSIFQNYPNPFNPNTIIKYYVPQTSQVQIKVFDVLGNEIETLVNEEKPAGTYEITWNAENLPSGVYFYQINAGGFVEAKKMALIK
jgi:photosystem II stability/assembly factor-like uncharacterized protein